MLIIRNCRVVTIQMKLVLTNSIFPLLRKQAASEAVLDAFTQFDEAEVP